jgi:hypothetical protein
MLRYIPLERLSFNTLFDGRLEKWEVKEVITESTTDSNRLLVHGDEVLAQMRGARRPLLPSWRTPITIQYSGCHLSRVWD